MNRTEYMRELDALLHGISKEEREEAMQYYNDYFDDAGSENEEKVIEELGSPAKLAETIRAGINGNTDEAESYGEYGERGYQDRRFDSSEYPAGRDDHYKDSYSETYGENQSQNDRNPFSERQYSYTANSNQGYTYAGNQGYGAGQTTENATEEIQCRQDHFDHLYPFDWASNCSSDSTWSSSSGIWSSGCTCNISNSDLGGSSCNRSRRDSVGDSRIWSDVLFPGSWNRNVWCRLPAAGTWGSIYSIDRMGMHQTDSNDVPWTCKSLSQTISEKER